MTSLSKNFTLEELCASSTAKALGIKNVPSEAVKKNLALLCKNVLQPLRDAYNGPVKIGSGYRCSALNKAVGGVSNSQHVSGQAADLCIDGNMARCNTWFEWIRTHVEFDQLILEHNKKGTYWVHVSYKETGNRKQVIYNLLKK